MTSFCGVVLPRLLSAFRFVNNWHFYCIWWSPTRKQVGDCGLKPIHALPLSVWFFI